MLLFVHGGDVLRHHPVRSVAHVQGLARLFRAVGEAAVAQVLGEEDRVAGLDL